MCRLTFLDSVTFMVERLSNRQFMTQFPITKYEHNYWQNLHFLAFRQSLQQNKLFLIKTGTMLSTNFNSLICLYKLILIQAIVYSTNPHSLTSVQLISILKPFSDCTTIIYVFNQTSQRMETASPIVLLDKETNRTKFGDSEALQRCSLVRRR